MSSSKIPPDTGFRLSFMKLLFVVQRYGVEIVGGAEYHCRLVAEHLAGRHQVEIATTCAMDYLTWKNVLAPGTGSVNGIPVHRFPVNRERSPDFDILAFHVLHGYPSPEEEIRYLEDHGPYCPELIDYVDSRSDIDRLILFSFRYWTTWQLLKRHGSRSILVPTAEHDRSIYLPIHRESLTRPRAIAYNSIEERQLIQYLSGNGHVPGEIVGVGLPDVNSSDDPDILRRFSLPESYFLYIGRIEQAKGCMEMIQLILRYFRDSAQCPELALIGKQEMPLPDHANIHYLGVLSEAEKLAILANARALIMPSRLESLSMVVLEAWKLCKPVLCNGQCDVLKGQCIRSGGGLYYRNADEFFHCLQLLMHRNDLCITLGNQGNRYYLEHYNWLAIMAKYEKLLCA